MPKNVYPVYKGLQKPIEFMGIRGRFLLYGAGAVLASFIGYIVSTFFLGQLMSLGVMFLIIPVSGIYIFLKQRQGLHSKKRFRGIYVYHNIYNR